MQRLCQTDRNLYRIVFIEIFIIFQRTKRQNQKRQKDKAARPFRLYRQGESSSDLWQSNHPIPITTFLSLRNTTMSFLAIHHVAIICSDYARSKQFYTQTLGLKIIAEAYRAERQSYKLDLAVADGTQLELFSFPNPPERPSRPEACGLRHLAFAVADVEYIKKDLEQKGVAVEAIRIDEYTGKKFTFFEDPDGLPLEVYEVVT